VTLVTVEQPFRVMRLERSTTEPASAYPSTQAASQLEGEHQQLHKGMGL